MTEANNCKFHCKNLIGTFVCDCPEGFRRPGREDNCVDIDECAELEAAAACGVAGARCINTLGGYQCQCPPGYVTSAEGRGCEVELQTKVYTKICNHGAEKASTTTGVFSWLIAATTAFTFKTLLRHYAKPNRR